MLNLGIGDKGISLINEQVWLVFIMNTMEETNLFLKLYWMLYKYAYRLKLTQISNPNIYRAITTIFANISVLRIFTVQLLLLLLLSSLLYYYLSLTFSGNNCFAAVQCHIFSRPALSLFEGTSILTITCHF